MKKFEGILMVSDLDGTLLRNDKSISEENLRAIEYFKSNGGTFAFVTGRIPSGAKRIFDIVKPNAPCGCINGGGIYDYENEKMLWCDALSDDVYDLVEYIEKNNSSIGIEVNSYYKIFFCQKNSSTEKHRKNENFPDLEARYRDIKEPIAKILFADEDEENLLKVIKMLKTYPKANKYDFIRSDKEYYEILPKGASKGNVMVKLAEILGIDIKNTISVGDNDNDVSMLKSAKVGFAVANATEDAKASADFITVSNEDNAIAKIIYDLDKGLIF